MRLRANFLALVTALAVPFSSWAAQTTLTFGELPTQPVNGLTFQGVTFAFTVGGVPSTDANYNSGGPGVTTFVQDPSLEGNASGILQLDFVFPTSILRFGVALSTTSAVTPGFTLQLFDAGLNSLGTTAVNTTPLVSFSEAQFVYGGLTPVRRVRIDFNEAAAARFALDNLTFDFSCQPHTVHGHISTVPPSHIGNASHEHHGQHGHTVARNCPPHAPGHSAGLIPEPEEAFGALRAATPSVVTALNEDGTFNGYAQAPSLAGTVQRPARRGSILQLFGSAGGLSLVYRDETPGVWGRRALYYTSSMPDVRVAGVPARVLFSGLAPGLVDAWQIIIVVPEEVPAGTRVPVSIRHAGMDVGSISVALE